MCFFDELHEIPENYRWFITEDNQIIGIDKSELTKSDENLLLVFLKPHNIMIPQPTEQEQKWRRRISDHTRDEQVHPFRFVYFSIKANEIEPSLFKQAISNFYSTPISILWENEHEGIIIEEKPIIQEESISYEQIIKLLMGDLYINIKFFIGPYIDNLINLHHYYKTFLKSAEIGFIYADRPVVSYVEAISYHFVDQADKEFLHSIKKIVLRKLTEDPELLHSIKTFIESNLNVTVAAKKLHLHRNSLQYRLDKFIDKTGIDVRQFNGAMTVYLVILSMVHKD